MTNKKLLLLFVFSLLILSCSSSEDSVQNSNDINVPGQYIYDVDNNLYQTVGICNQTWMKSNLLVKHYRNGDAIPECVNFSDWDNLTSGAYRISNGLIFYNWYAITDPRGLAPQGYHVPNNNEWTELVNCLGNNNQVGFKLKESAVGAWWGNSGSNNASGFSATGEGFLDGGTHSYFRFYGVWWSNNNFYYQGSNKNYYCFSLNNNNGEFAYVSTGISFNLYNPNGFSVRCVKD